MHIYKCLWDCHMPVVSRVYWLVSCNQWPNFWGRQKDQCVPNWSKLGSTKNHLSMCLVCGAALGLLILRPLEMGLIWVLEDQVASTTISKKQLKRKKSKATCSVYYFTKPSVFVPINILWVWKISFIASFLPQTHLKNKVKQHFVV